MKLNCPCLLTASKHEFLRLGGRPLIIMESPIETTSPARKNITAHRNADSYFIAWERRTSLVKQQVAAESSANDAKTARLRALRLAKGAADKETGAPEAAAKRPARKRLITKV